MSGLVPKVMLTAATVAVIAVVTGALFVLDSPAVAAEKKRDIVMADDLSCMERQIARKYRDTSVLPTAGEVMGFACLNHGPAPSSVKYTPTGPDTYRLCATFRYPVQGRGMDSDHPAGEYCMNRNAGAKD